MPQTQQYCNGNFAAWDPKITTLPGTYLLTTAVARAARLMGWVRLRLQSVEGAASRRPFLQLALALYLLHSARP